MTRLVPTDPEVYAQAMAKRQPKTLPPPRVCSSCAQFRPAQSSASHLGFGWCSLLPSGYSMNANARCHFSPSQFVAKECAA